MRRSVVCILVVALGLSGCARVADSRFNPFNWFGTSTASANTDANGNIRPLVRENERPQIVDARQPVDQGVALRVDRSPDGAIVVATGLVQGQGAFSAELVPLGVADGTLTLSFRAMRGSGQSADSQSITAAYLISEAQLASIRIVRVETASNVLTSRR